VRKLDKWISFIASMKPLNKIIHLRIISDLYKIYNRPRTLCSARVHAEKCQCLSDMSGKQEIYEMVNANFSTKLIVHLQTPAKNPPRANKR
jgi:hypothetical protein